MDDPRDELILVLAERVYICSRLLTRTAERLGWDTIKVQELMRKLVDKTEADVCQYQRGRQQSSDQHLQG